VIEADVAVVGGGPAGIAAATVAAESGARVVLLDEGATLGGQIWRRDVLAAPKGSAAAWLDRLAASGAEVLSGWSVFDAEPRRLVGFRGIVRFHQVVIATGARERFLPFPGWTLPGVTGLGGLQAMVKSGCDVSDRRIVVGGSGPLAIAVAASLAERGAHVALVAEQASWVQIRPFLFAILREPRKFMQGLDYALALHPGVVRFGTWVVGAEGRDRVEAVRVTDGRRTWRERCDLLAVGYGLVPQTELAALLGCRVEEAVWVDREQRTTASGVFAAGEPTGIGGVECALIEGQIAGLAAVGREVDHLETERFRGLRFKDVLKTAFELRNELRHVPRPETIVCRCEDVRLVDLEPFVDRRTAKLVTRCGMGPCQGRVCGDSLEFLKKWGPNEVRPPLMPTSVGDLAR